MKRIFLFPKLLKVIKVISNEAIKYHKKNLPEASQSKIKSHCEERSNHLIKFPQTFTQTTFAIINY